ACGHGIWSFQPLLNSAEHREQADTVNQVDPLIRGEPLSVDGEPTCGDQRSSVSPSGDFRAKELADLVDLNRSALPVFALDKGLLVAASQDQIHTAVP